MVVIPAAVVVALPHRAMVLPAPADSPAAVLVDIPEAAPGDIPVVAAQVDIPVAAPVDIQVAAPVDIRVAAPVDIQVAAPVAAPVDILAVAPVDIPVVVAPVDRATLATVATNTKGIPKNALNCRSEPHYRDQDRKLQSSKNSLTHRGSISHSFCREEMNKELYIRRRVT